jgi:hypothetical protein
MPRLIRDTKGDNSKLSAAKVDVTESSEVIAKQNDSNTFPQYSDNSSADIVTKDIQDVNVKLNNPLAGISRDELQQMGRDYATIHGITEASDLRAFAIGAILAQDAQNTDAVKGLADEAEMNILIREYTHKWDQPWTLKIAVIVCSICAAVQGMVCIL